MPLKMTGFNLFEEELKKYENPDEIAAKAVDAAAPVLAGAVRPVGTDSKGVRNAEKMGYKEYGTSKQPAKPVLKKAVKKSEKECLEIMQKAFEEVTK